MSRLAKLLCLAVGLLFCVRSSFAVAVRVSDASVYVNELSVLTLKSGSLANRKSRAKALVPSLTALTDDSKLSLKKSGTGMKILDGERTVLVVSAAEAKAHGTSAGSLSETWIQALRKAVALPPIKFGETKLRTGANRKLSIELLGSLAAKAVLTVSDKNVVTIKRTPGKLIVFTKNVGKAIVQASFKDQKETLSVEVLPPAANLAGSVSATVTGNPASNEIVKGAVLGAIYNQLPTQPGAEIEVTIPKTAQVPSDRTMAIPAKVKVTAPNALPVEGTVNATVRNLALVYKPESVLWYCNDPENVKGPQQLFGANLERDKPARLLYHHMNVASVGLYITVQVVNDSDLTARVLVLPGDAHPDKNPVFAGIEAADMFLRHWVSYSGEVVTIPPKGSLPVTVRRLAPQETLSGLCYLRLLEGGPQTLAVRTDARGPMEMTPRLVSALESPTPWRFLGSAPVGLLPTRGSELSEHIYPYPFKTEVVDYQVGGRHGFVRIGQKPIPRQGTGRGLDGNFGVFYTIDAALTNPLSEPVDVEVLFEASAGYSGALFVLNGSVLRTPLLQPKEEFQILKLKLQPNSKKNVSMMTIPLSGSSYPSTIIIRPIDPSYNRITSGSGGG